MLIDTGSIINIVNKVVGVLAFVKLLDSIAISPLTVSISVNVHPLRVIIVESSEKVFLILTGDCNIYSFSS